MTIAMIAVVIPVAHDVAAEAIDVVTEVRPVAIAVAIAAIPVETD